MHTHTRTGVHTHLFGSWEGVGLQVRRDLSYAG